MTVHQAYDIHDETYLFAVEGAPEGWRTTLLEREVMRIQSPQGRSIVHATFSLQRIYDASPAQVFHALSDKAAKARWFEGGDGYTPLEREMDVRPGGRERLKGRWASGMVSIFDAVYFDVVLNERLVYAYEMSLDNRKISVSLATIELKPEGAGTRLVVSEQGAFLDGYDDAGSRERRTGFPVGSAWRIAPTITMKPPLPATPRCAHGRASQPPNVPIFRAIPRVSSQRGSFRLIIHNW
jgi:uncharacterized protein YndB with AHSA1/START domain